MRINKKFSTVWAKIRNRIRSTKARTTSAQVDLARSGADWKVFAACHLMTHAPRFRSRLANYLWPVRNSKPHRKPATVRLRNEERLKLETKQKLSGEGPGYINLINRTAHKTFQRQQHRAIGPSNEIKLKSPSSMHQKETVINQSAL